MKALTRDDLNYYHDWCHRQRVAWRDAGRSDMADLWLARAEALSWLMEEVPWQS